MEYFLREWQRATAAMNARIRNMNLNQSSSSVNRALYVVQMGLKEDPFRRTWEVSI